MLKVEGGGGVPIDPPKGFVASRVNTKVHIFWLKI